MKKVVYIWAFIAFLDALVYGAVAPVMPAFAQQSGLSVAETAMLGGAFVWVSILVLPLNLTLLKFFSPRLLLIAGLCLGVLLYGLFLPGLDKWALFAIRALQGLVTSMMWIGLVGSVMAEKKSGRLVHYGWAFGIVFAAYTMGVAMGKGAGLLPFPEYTFQIIAGLNLIALVLMLTLTPRQHQRVIPDISLKAFKHKPAIIGLLAYVLSGVAIGIMSTSSPLLFFEHGLSSAGVSALFMIGVIPVMLFAPRVSAWFQHHSSLTTIVLLSTLLMIATGLINSVSHVIWWAVMIAVCRMLFTCVQSVSMITFAADKDNAGRYLFIAALSGWASNVGYGGASIVSGNASEMFSSHTVGAWSAVAAMTAFVLIAYAAWWTISGRKRRAPSAPENLNTTS